MSRVNRANNRSAWVIGGTTLMGMGVGFVLLYLLGSGLLLVASILVGIGLGVALAPLISR